MSNQAICIEPLGYDTPCPTPLHPSPPPAPARIRAPAIPNHMVRYSESSIRHTEFGIRESEFGNPRKHWPECGSDNSSWCGIFPLDHDGYGAVGSPPI